MSSEKNIYSQSFNFGGLVQKGVDPRTGQYTCSITVYETPSEARNCPPLVLSISYNPLSSRDVGLGQGWSFNLSTYQHRQSKKTILLSTGENYQVEETSSGISVKDQKLQSFVFKKLVSVDNNGKKVTSYHISHKSGLVEVLSNAQNSFDSTVPVKLYSETGRSLDLIWTASGERPRLSKIQESGEDLLQITYKDAGVEILRNPNTSEASKLNIKKTNNRLVELALPVAGPGGEGNAAWKLLYQTFSQGFSGLSSVTSPPGLLEIIQYKEEGHRLPPKAPYKTIPYVISHTMYPGYQQPLTKTTYAFSDHNFLGYSGCIDWEDGVDNLFRTPDDYQYTSTMKVYGGTETKHTYNKFHLVVHSTQQKGTKRTTQATKYHALKNTSFKDQPAQYQLPKTVEKTYYDTATKASRIETSHHDFDKWGNSIQEIKPNGIKIARIYYPPAGEKDTNTGDVLCPADPNGFRRYIKEEAVTPAASAYEAPTRSKRYIYGTLPAATGPCPTTYFVIASKIQVLENDHRLYNTDYSFVNKPITRDHGRQLKTITLMSGKYPKTVNWTYQYPSTESLSETTKTTTFDSIVTQDETKYSLLSGSVIYHKDPSGATSLVRYDKINRPVSITVNPNTSYEATQTHEYTILSQGGKAGGSCLTLTNLKGVKRRLLTDGMERGCRIEAQDDDGEWKEQNGVKTYNGTFRLVQERQYNSIGQCVKMTNVDWLRASESGKGEPTEQRSTQTFEYDDWGQQCKVTRGSGVVSSLVADPISLTSTKRTNGEGKTETHLDLFGLPTQTKLLNKDDSLHSVDTYGNDGLGRQVMQKDNASHKKVIKYDSFDRNKQTTWPDNHTTKTEYASQSAASLPVSMSIGVDTPLATQSFDGSDRLCKRTVAGRATQQSYDGSNAVPSVITTPKGDKQNLSYDSTWKRALTSLASSEGTDTYLYNKRTMAMEQFKGERGNTKFGYIASGRVANETMKAQGNKEELATHSTYSMAGKLQYYKDVHGRLHEMQFDTFGRPKKLVLGKSNVTLNYDSADRLSESKSTDDSSGRSLTTSLRYDDFGREIGRIVLQCGKDNSSKTLYQMIQVYDDLGLVKTRDIQDANDKLLRREYFKYDSLRRLIDYQCQGTDSEWLPVDEKGHQLKHQEFKFNDYNSLTEVSTTFQDDKKNKKSYTYSRQDPTQVIKITNTHTDYPSEIVLTYDANGCLTCDEQSRTMEYDSLSRLTAVRDSKKNLLSQYLYDATGKLMRQIVPGEADTEFYYRNNRLIAIQNGGSKTSYLSDGAIYWGQSTATAQQDGSTAVTAQVFASDFHQSVMTSLDSSSTYTTRYTPYGIASSSASNASIPSVAFNGQWRDPVTGWYHLGNGYRVYNPVLKCFHSPDAWSPFISGDVNAYAYCSGDPINHIDPSGHLSIFGHEISDRDVAIIGVGIGVGIAVGILTAGAGFAVVVGASIAAGALSDVATGAAYDWASGKSPTWESVGTDALYGAVGGLLGEVAGKALEGVGRGVASGFKASARRVSKAVGRSGSFSPSAELRSSMRMRNLYAHPLGTPPEVLPVVFDNMLARPGNIGWMTHGGETGMLLGRNGFHRASVVAREDILPALQRLQEELAPGTRMEPVFTLMACHGYESGAGFAVSQVLGQEISCFRGILTFPNGSTWGSIFRGLESPGGIDLIFPGAENHIVQSFRF
ncbi:hypothetical protein FHL15_005626 [Xylaria flabelliformis]|uniref:Insecticide toxin TcdB middle/N-terminal domain-containing protein n=1 Tax=Xylaria flabelliformis TaxID=2512241 RepID=A0A553HZH9_9PEZI|nr:hypothetical protein FHL15_005626 [Xylaria flabelliformis]